ncbi:hypothetical protein [Nonomuraea sp. NPDC050310]|uniref:hypothetical protein n=1 Tax=Nonomuraea sp. NPDC050310 TaxID=3154935 RepID=UPI0033E30841
MAAGVAAGVAAADGCSSGASAPSTGFWGAEPAGALIPLAFPVATSASWVSRRCRNSSRSSTRAGQALVPGVEGLGRQLPRQHAHPGAGVVRADRPRHC